MCVCAAEKNAGDAAEDAATDARERPVMITHAQRHERKHALIEKCTQVTFPSYTVLHHVSDNGSGNVCILITVYPPDRDTPDDKLYCIFAKPFAWCFGVPAYQVQM